MIGGHSITSWSFLWTFFFFPRSFTQNLCMDIGLPDFFRTPNGTLPCFLGTAPIAVPCSTVQVSSVRTFRQFKYPRSTFHSIVRDHGFANFTARPNDQSRTCMSKAGQKEWLQRRYNIIVASGWLIVSVLETRCRQLICVHILTAFPPLPLVILLTSLTTHTNHPNS